MDKLRSTRWIGKSTYQFGRASIARNLVSLASLAFTPGGLADDVYKSVQRNPMLCWTVLCCGTLVVHVLVLARRSGSPQRSYFYFCPMVVLPNQLVHTAVIPSRTRLACVFSARGLGVVFSCSWCISFAVRPGEDRQGFHTVRTSRRRCLSRAL